MRDALARLEEMDRGRRLPFSHGTVRARECAGRMANRNRALAEDARLLEDTRRLMQVERIEEKKSVVGQAFLLWTCSEPASTGPPLAPPSGPAPGS